MEINVKMQFIHLCVFALRRFINIKNTENTIT